MEPKEPIDEQFDFREEEIDDREPLDFDEPDDPVRERDEMEYRIVAENQRRFEEDNPRE